MGRIINWKCLDCGKINESDSSKTHNLDYCECGESAVDAEEFYTRLIGNVKLINE